MPRLHLYGVASLAMLVALWCRSTCAPHLRHACPQNVDVCLAVDVLIVDVIKSSLSGEIVKEYFRDCCYPILA